MVCIKPVKTKEYNRKWVVAIGSEKHTLSTKQVLENRHLIRPWAEVENDVLERAFQTLFERLGEHMGLKRHWKIDWTTTTETIEGLSRRAKGGEVKT